MTMSFTFDFVSFATAFTSRREMVQVPNDRWLDSDTLNSVFGASGSVRGGFARSAVTRCPTFAIALPRSGHDWKNSRCWVKNLAQESLISSKISGIRLSFGEGNGGGPRCRNSSGAQRYAGT